MQNDRAGAGQDGRTCLEATFLSGANERGQQVNKTDKGKSIFSPVQFLRLAGGGDYDDREQDLRPFYSAWCPVC